MIAKRMIVQFTFVFFALYGLDRSPAFCDQGQAKYTQTQDQTVKGKTVKDKVTKQFLESQEKKLVDFVRPILSFFTKKQLLTSEELNDYGQENWLRPRDSERTSSKVKMHYQTLLSPLTRHDQDVLLAYLDQHDFIGDVVPKKQSYDVIFIMGATVHTMVRRLGFLNTLVKTNKLVVTSKTKIIFLVGDRKLTPEENTYIKNMISSEDPSRDLKVNEKVRLLNETDLPEFLWSSQALDPQVKAASFQAVKAPALNKAFRATTMDTLLHYLKENKPRQKNSLVVSSNPYVMYQGWATRKAFLKNGYDIRSIECCGPGFSLEDLREVMSSKQEGADVTIKRVHLLGDALDALAAALYYFVGTKEAFYVS